MQWRMLNGSRRIRGSHQFSFKCHPAYIIMLFLGSSFVISPPWFRWGHICLVSIDLEVDVLPIAFALLLAWCVAHGCILQVEGGTAHLPVTDLSIRAEPLTPQQWREKLKARAIVGTTDSSRLKRVLLLDVRNGTSKFPSLFSPPWSHCNLILALLHFISIQYVISYMAIKTALFCFFSLPPSTNTAVLSWSWIPKVMFHQEWKHQFSMSSGFSYVTIS